MYLKSFSLCFLFSFSLYTTALDVENIKCLEDENDDNLSGTVSKVVLKEAVERCVVYFETSDDSDLSQMINYDYLQRKFNIKDLFPKEAITEKLNRHGDIMIFHNALFYRLVDKTFTAKKEVVESDYRNLMTELMLKAIYSDIYPLEPDFIKKVKEQGKNGGYLLTHAMLSLQWAEENNAFDPKDYMKLKRELAIEMVKLVDKAKEFDDLTIEAVTFLLYTGFDDMVKDDWIVKILEVQQEDGGWKWNSEQKNSDSHPSMLALWALLDWLHPENTTPWIE